MFLPVRRGIWRKNLYCVTPLLSGEGYWDRQAWMWNTILFDLPSKTTKSKLNSKSCKSEGKIASLKPFTNDPAATKHGVCHWSTVSAEKENERENSQNLHYQGCIRIWFLGFCCQLIRLKLLPSWAVFPLVSPQALWQPALCGKPHTK